MTLIPYDKPIRGLRRLCAAALALPLVTAAAPEAQAATILDGFGPGGRPAWDGAGAMGCGGARTGRSAVLLHVCDQPDALCRIGLLVGLLGRD